MLDRLFVFTMGFTHFSQLQSGSNVTRPIDLEWKKQQSQEIVTLLNSSIVQLKKLLSSYEMTIQMKKQILEELDKKITRKLSAFHVKPIESGLVMKQGSK